MKTKSRDYLTKFLFSHKSEFIVNSIINSNIIFSKSL